MKKDIDILLESVKQVDAPPFLFTRISQKIVKSKNNNLTLKFKASFVAAAVVLLIINAIAFNQFSNNNNHQQKETVNTTYTTVKNNIYNE